MAVEDNARVSSSLGSLRRMGLFFYTIISVGLN